MDTLRQLCSDISTELKSNNIDDRYSFRFLSSRIKDKIKNFIKQDADNRRLSKLIDIFYTFPIIDMEEVPYINYNVDIPDNRSLMKSKKPIINTLSTNYGNLITIFDISGDTKYTLIKHADYKDILNLEYRDKRIKYAWIEEGYLFIPESTTEKVKAIGIPENPEELSCEPCSKPLDTELPFPQYLIDIVKKDIITELTGEKRIVEDDNPNLNNSEK